MEDFVFAFVMAISIISEEWMINIHKVQDKYHY